MRHLLLFLYQHANWFVFLLLQGLCLLLIASYSSYHGSALRNTGMEIAGYGLAVYQKATQYLRLGEENQRLAAENARLRQQVMLKASGTDSVQVSTSGQHEYAYSVARVIQATSTANNNYLMIDKGAADGIEPRMGIIGPDGVVGIVRNVSPHFASAYSLLHNKVAVSARIGNGGARGTIRWDGRSMYHVQLEEIPRQQRIARGDTVFTSGLSRIFPDRIPIGVIDSYHLPEGSNFYQIRLRLTTQYNRLDHVYVVRHLMRHEMDSLTNLLSHDQ